LIEAGADINVQNDFGSTPGRNEISDGSEDACRLLLEAGAKLEYRDKKQRTALWYAIACGHENFVRLLIEAGVDLETWIDGMTPLAVAVEYNEFGIVEQLLNAGADVHSRDENGRLALSNVETSWIDPRIRHLLLNYGSDVLMSDDEDYVESGIRFVRDDYDVDEDGDMYDSVEEDIFAGRVFGGTVRKVENDREDGEVKERDEQSNGREDVLGAPKGGNDDGSEQMDGLGTG
jgi:Ankyrin repeats (3 copies)